MRRAGFVAFIGDGIALCVAERSDEISFLTVHGRQIVAEHIEHQLQDDNSFACASCAYQEASSLLPLLQRNFVLFAKPAVLAAVHSPRLACASSADYMLSILSALAPGFDRIKFKPRCLAMVACTVGHAHHSKVGAWMMVAERNHSRERLDHWTIFSAAMQLGAWKLLACVLVTRGTLPQLQQQLHFGIYLQRLMEYVLQEGALNDDDVCLKFDGF